MTVVGKDGVRIPGRVSDLAVYSGLERTDVDQAEAGEIVAVAGLEQFSIGDTIADAEEPIALPRVTIDEPTELMLTMWPLLRLSMPGRKAWVTLKVAK